jgi:branched-chain amino acid transport system permease protein
LRGFYLALVTLSFPLILTGIFYIFPDFTGGEFGLYGIRPLSVSRVLDYYIVTLSMLISVFVMWKFTDARSKIVRIGVILRAIHEDEITARTSGICTTKYKSLAFAVSGFFAGIAGGLYAHFFRVAGPSTLELFFSFQAILWTIFGGIATIYGPVAGVFILYPLLELLQLNPVGEKIRFILFALLLMFTLLFMPEGITTWVRDRIEVKCPRCKLINAVSRRNCRACRAPLHIEEKKERIQN